jgi:hypothetical protein
MKKEYILISGNNHKILDTVMCEKYSSIDYARNSGYDWYWGGEKDQETDAEKIARIRNEKIDSILQ